MKKITIISMFCAAISLNACDHYSTKLVAMDGYSSNVANISPAAGGETTFRSHLANEYMQLANYENNTKHDYRAAKYYTDKMEVLNKGNLVSPASLNDFEIGNDYVADVEAERENLITALQTYNIPENREALAKAQSRYDCWLEQLEEKPDDMNEPLTCEIEYKQAMASLMLPFDRDMRFSIPFDEAGSMANTQGQTSMSKVLNLYNRNQDRDVNLTLIPPSTASAEQADSQVSKVRSILQYNGIPADKIKVMRTAKDVLIPTHNFEILISAPTVESSVVPVI